jgi:hypothetical protein
LSKENLLTNCLINETNFQINSQNKSLCQHQLQASLYLFSHNLLIFFLFLLFSVLEFLVYKSNSWKNEGVQLKDTERQWTDSQLTSPLWISVSITSISNIAQHQSSQSDLAHFAASRKKCRSNISKITCNWTKTMRDLC